MEYFKIENIRNKPGNFSSYVYKISKEDVNFCIKISEYVKIKESDMYEYIKSKGFYSIPKIFAKSNFETFGKKFEIIIMEYFPYTLREFISSCGSLYEKMKVIRKIIKMISEFHEKVNYVLCDIKPDNILMKDLNDENIVLCDFYGIVRNNSSKLIVKTKLYSSRNIDAYVDGKIISFVDDWETLGYTISEILEGRLDWTFSKSENLNREKNKYLDKITKSKKIKDRLMYNYFSNVFSGNFSNIDQIFLHIFCI